MASGSAAPGGFHRGRRTADRYAIFLAAAGNRTAGPDGAIVPASILRAPALLLCGTHAPRQRVQNQRLAPGRIAHLNIRRDVAHSEAILEERSQARTQTKSRKHPGRQHASYPNNVEVSNSAW